MNDNPCISPSLDSRPWTSAELSPEVVGVHYEIKLHDGTINEALWTGSRWWSHGQIEPAAWRPLPQTGDSD
jgi:hypothetical protein